MGVITAIVLVAIAGRAPLSHSAPVNAASAQSPVIALFVLLAGAGVVALAALAMVLWPGRRSKGGEEPERVSEPPPVHWIWKLLAILLPFALAAALVAAAVLGTKTVRHSAQFRGSGTVARLPSARVAPRGGSGAFVLPGWLPWTALAIVLVAGASGAILLMGRRARPMKEPPEGEAARAAVEAAIGALDAATDPRGAVIAAYAAMERTLAAHGVTRSESEAPREYLRRVLAEASQTEREARTLTGLFEEARFSAHPIPERVRELAQAALSSLRVRLGAVQVP